MSSAGERHRCRVLRMGHETRYGIYDRAQNCPVCGKPCVSKFWDEHKKIMSYKHYPMKRFKPATYCEVKSGGDT